MADEWTNRLAAQHTLKPQCRMVLESAYHVRLRRCTVVGRRVTRSCRDFSSDSGIREWHHKAPALSLHRCKFCFLRVLLFLPCSTQNTSTTRANLQRQNSRLLTTSLFSIARNTRTVLKPTRNDVSTKFSRLGAPEACFARSLHWQGAYTWRTRGCDEADGNSAWIKSNVSTLDLKLNF